MASHDDASPTSTEQSKPCDCDKVRWGYLNCEALSQWPVLETAEWEELRNCPQCGQVVLTCWPHEENGRPIYCRPYPETAKRLRDVDWATTLRPYLLHRLEGHFGELKQSNKVCRKAGCTKHAIKGSVLCLEHLIAKRFGRNYANIDANDRQTVAAESL